MLADTWAKVIKCHYKLKDELFFTGKDLIKALSSKSHQHLANSMTINQNNIPHDHLLGIFHDVYGQNIKEYPCHLSMQQHQVLSQLKQTEYPWFENICNAIDLINKTIT